MKFFRCQINGGTITPYLARYPVQFQIPDLHLHLLPVACLAARKCSYACLKFGERKRLYEIIVTAGLQPHHTIIYTVQCRKKKGWDVDLGHPQCAKQGQSINAGEHAVDD